MEAFENMIVINKIGDVHEILLYIMEHFHLLCEKNNLVYNIDSGTFIGAIRHKGFIPWDDDIDVTMPRDDYNKLGEIIRNEKNGLFEIHQYPQKNYPYPFAKIGLKGTYIIENGLLPEYTGLSFGIDVFPVDGFPEPSPKVINPYFNKLLRLKAKRVNCIAKTTKSDNKFRALFYPIKIARSKAFQKIGYKHYLDKEIEMLEKYSITDSTYISCGTSWRKTVFIPKEVYFDRTQYLFENLYLWGIKQFDLVLKQQYGNYMELPPEKQQIPHHDYTLYVSPVVLNRIKKKID